MNMQHAAAAIVALATTATVAQGALVPLVPGAGVGLSGTNLFTDPVLGGSTPTGGDMSSAFQISDGDALIYSGTLTSRISISDDTGELIFSYRVRDGAPGLNGIIASVAIDSFTGWTTDVEYRTDGLGDVGPSRAERSADGDELAFLMGNTPVLNGSTESFFFFALTDAPDYGLGTATVTLTTGQSATLDVIVPVPAPGAATVAGLVGLAALRRRR